MAALDGAESVMSSQQQQDADKAAADQVSRCLVYCRMRPSKPADFEDEAYQLLHLNKKRVSVKDERNYDFDGTFDQDCKQADIFDAVAKPCLDNTFKGFNSAILAYGQTGTGKTYTMVALNKGDQGVIPRSAEYIFEQVRADATRKYTVTAQFIQIYRDQLGDLMVEGGKEKVDIRYEPGEGGVTLPGCVTTELTSAEEFMEFFHEGDQRRVVRATAMNPESSRGHTALVVRIASEPTDEDDCGARISAKITFIDLAGYERFSKTGISNANPIQKDEAKTINGSLLALGHVVTSLSNGDKHIPWRNAKLTRLLQDSIGGRSRTSIILTVGPSSEHLHESTNTLQFGQRAMAVKVQAKVTSSVDFEKLAAKLQEMLNEKDKQISGLEIKLAESNMQREELVQRQDRDEEDLRSRQQEELAKLKEEGASAEKILEVTNLFDVELENLKEQQREELSYQQEAADDEMKLLLEEQSKLTRRKEDEARHREESRLKELEAKLAQARGGDSTNDLERCLKQLAERDAVLVSRAGERARLQGLCATLIQQVRQLGGTPTHGGEFEENFLDLIQVEEMRSMFEVENESLQNQVSDIRIQLERIQEVANSRSQECDMLREELEQLQENGTASAGENQQQQQTNHSITSSNNDNSDAPGDADTAGDGGENSATSKPPMGIPSLKLGSLGSPGAVDGREDSTFSLPPLNSTTKAGLMSGGGQLTARGTAREHMVDRSEIETVKTLMQVDIDMLNTKVKMLEQQLSQAQQENAGSSPQAHHEGGGGVANNDSFTEPQRTGRRRAGTIRLGSAPPMVGSGDSLSSNNINQQQQSSHHGNNDPNELKKELNELRNKNLGFESANVALHEHVSYLEKLVDDLGGSAMPAPPQENVATIENVVKTAQDISKAKSDELERLLSLLDAREAVINDQAMQIATLSEDSRRVRKKYPQIVKDLDSSNDSNNNNDTAPTQLMTQQHSQQIKNFVELIRAARAAQRTAEEKLFTLQSKNAAQKLSSIMNDDDSTNISGLLPSGSSNNNNNDQKKKSDFVLEDTIVMGDTINNNNKHVDPNNFDDIDDLLTTLRKNDEKVLESDQRIIELESQNTSLKRMVAALERQLEIASMTPICGLSKEDREFVDTEREKDSSQAKEAQAELEAQLKAQLEEKQKIQSMLDDMSKKRAQEAAVYSSVENQLEEQKAEIQKKVEEDRKSSNEEMLKLQRVADEHAAEARRLKQALEERDKKEREAAEEADRVKKQLKDFEEQQKKREEEAVKLRAELEEKSKATSDKDSEAEKLKQQLEENTKAMMAEQARKQLEALDGESKKAGFFDRLKNWKI